MLRIYFFHHPEGCSDKDDGVDVGGDDSDNEDVNVDDNDMLITKMVMNIMMFVLVVGDDGDMLMMAMVVMMAMDLFSRKCKLLISDPMSFPGEILSY